MDRMGPLQSTLAVGCGGFVGAVLRYLVSRSVERVVGTLWPWGTLLVNVAGCAAAGVLLRVLSARGGGEGGLRLFVGVGLLGALTTFSTFGVETFLLWRSGRVGMALASVAANVALGLGAVAAGWKLSGP